MKVTRFERRRAQQEISRRVTELRAAGHVVELVEDYLVLAVADIDGLHMTMDPLRYLDRLKHERDIKATQ